MFVTFFYISVFQVERVLDSFNMVISGIKTTFYTQCMKSNYVRITNRNIKTFYSDLKKWIFAISIHSAGTIYTLQILNFKNFAKYVNIILVSAFEWWFYVSNSSCEFCSTALRNHMWIVFKDMSSWTDLTMYLGMKTTF